MGSRSPKDRAGRALVDFNVSIDVLQRDSLQTHLDRLLIRHQARRTQLSAATRRSCPILASSSDSLTKWRCLRPHSSALSSFLHNARNVLNKNSSGRVLHVVSIKPRHSCSQTCLVVYPLVVRMADFTCTVDQHTGIRQLLHTCLSLTSLSYR